MCLKDNLLTIQKLQTACFYHKHSKSYKLLNMTSLKKTLCKVRIFFILKYSMQPYLYAFKHHI